MTADVHLCVNDLIDYTDWQRNKWHAWFMRQQEEVLKISVGPHGDGRFETIGDLIRHIFSAEKRYIERLSGRPLTDTSSIPTDKVETLFEFSQQGRHDLRTFIDSFPSKDWDVPQDLTIGKYSLKATPKKIAIHILMHEIRHWAQIATLLQLQGMKDEFHDFLFSPVFSVEQGSEKG